MTWKKRIFISLILIVLVLIADIIHYCWTSFPILTGYGAKVMCSAVFVSGRDPKHVLKEELGNSPLSLGTFDVDYKDSSVTGSIFGFAKRKAIFRDGLGATVVTGISEQEIRDQEKTPFFNHMPNQDTIPWPRGNRLGDALPANVDYEKLRQVVHRSFSEKDSARPIRTRAVLVIYKGQIIDEEYAPGFTKDSRMIGWSMAKTITGALIGILVKQGKINVDSPASVPEWKDPEDPRHAITVKDLLQQSSGLNFNEDYGKSSDATDMLYKKANMAAYTASLPLKRKPGTFFYYSSGNTNILSRIIRQTVGDSAYNSFPYTHLFDKLGMYSAVLEPDASGTFVGSSYVYANARDWARFGLFLLNNGVVSNEPVLPDDWVKKSTTPAPAAKMKNYGYQIWLNAGRKFPDAPEDMFYADGYEGQYVFVIPSRDLVIVRLGQTHFDNFDVNDFLKDILVTIH
ncbi:MAG: serine hydrolase [Bacteroidetes bacterium]|nr:MAG: serine hydrolase [Bacteroidota bacterium]